MKKFKNKPNEAYKIGGKTIWNSRSVSVDVVVIANKIDDPEEYYLLMVKRGSALPDKVGKWCLPCGYLDWNEDGTNAMIRELYEETGLDLQKDILNNQKNIKEIISSSFTQPFYVNTDINMPYQNVALAYGIHFKCIELPEFPKEFNEEAETAEARWVNLKDLYNYDWAFNSQPSLHLKYMLHHI